MNAEEWSMWSTIGMLEPERDENQEDHAHYSVVANNNHDQNHKLSNHELNAKGHDHIHKNFHGGHDDHYYRIDHV